MLTNVRVRFLGICVISILTYFLFKKDTPKGLKTGKLAAELEAAKDISKKESTKYVLLYTPFVLIDDWYMEFGYDAFSTCPIKNCYLTNDRSKLQSISDYDALLFHDRNICVTKMPNPKERRPEQIYIFTLNESPLNTRVDLRLDKYKSYFNWTMTYRTDSDIFFPYGKASPREPDDAANYISGETLLKEKKHLVAFVTRNCRTNIKRFGLLEDLGKYLNISKRGRCYGEELSEEEMTAMLKQHKFYLALENSICNDYITEKFWRSLDLGLVPIVIGVNHDSVAPPHSYINSKDFADAEELAKHLQWLDQNDEEYLKYFEWRKSYSIEHYYFTKSFCQICEKLHNPGTEAKSYADPASWLEDGQCGDTNIEKWLACPSNQKELDEDLHNRKWE